jgi:hypothetical protein
MAYAFSATEFQADPDTLFLGFGDGGRHYLWMQPDEEADGAAPASTDAGNVWVEIHDQQFGGHGGVARVELSRRRLWVWRTAPLPRHAGGHAHIDIAFDVSDAEFEQIAAVLLAMMRGNEHLLHIRRDG